MSEPIEFRWVSMSQAPFVVIPSPLPPAQIVDGPTVDTIRPGVRRFEVERIEGIDGVWLRVAWADGVVLLDSDQVPAMERGVWVEWLRSKWGLHGHPWGPCRRSDIRRGQ